MKFGIVYPQNEYPTTPKAVREFALRAEGLGYHHILTYEHILGANPLRPGGWDGPYTYQDAFLDPFTMFSYMAGLTTSLEFVTGILILPQRQTVLTAKQAACLDILSNGRLRLGVGLGWNPVEYQAQNESFTNRGRRIEEQVQVMRELWTKPLVTMKGKWHHIDDAGINPLPVQRPIPIWFGGNAEPALRRIARLADGWFPTPATIAATAAQRAVVADELRKNDRTEEQFGVEPRISYGTGDLDQILRNLDEWRSVGAGYASLNTLNLGYKSPDEHFSAMEKFSTGVIRRSSS